MKVTLRQRTKGDKVSLYLDYYHKGKREYEYLELYLFPEPEKGKLTKEQKESNKETLALAESISSKRQIEIKNGIYGFQDQSKLKGIFLRYVEYLSYKRKFSHFNYDNWDSALKHLKKYVKFDVSFGQADKNFLDGFREYLMKEAKTPSKQPLSQNSQSSYFNKIRAALKQAYKEGIIKQNPADLVDGIKPGEPEREFLTYEELQAVAKAECEIPLLKTAFLFSAMTGLRWSDVQKLVWSEVQHSKEVGYYIRFRQKKTKASHDISIRNSGRSDSGNLFSRIKYKRFTGSRSTGSNPVDKTKLSRGKRTPIHIETTAIGSINVDLTDYLNVVLLVSVVPSLFQSSKNSSHFNSP